MLKEKAAFDAFFQILAGLVELKKCLNLLSEV